MPRYDFKCRSCSYIFEAIVPNDLEHLPCIKCNTALIISFDPIYADRQLCTPAVIQIH